MGKGDSHADHDFSLVSKVKCAKFNQDRNVEQHRILQLVQFFFLNFQNHREHVLSNLWKFHRTRMNAVCSYRATPGTPASTFFFNFQIHREHVYNFWKLHHDRMSGVCSCKATPGIPTSTIFKFLNFQNHREHVSSNLWKFHRNWMNGACSCRESATPGTPASTIFKFFKFPKPPRECLQQLAEVSSQSDEWCWLLYRTHRQTLIFIYSIVPELSNVTNPVS